MEMRLEIICRLSLFTALSRLGIDTVLGLLPRTIFLCVTKPKVQTSESTRYDADTVKGKCEKLDFWLDFHMGTVNQIYSDKRLKL